MAEPAYREPEAESPRLPGPISDAVHFFGEMLKHDPASRVFAILAEELCSRKMWKEAVETCRRGLAFHPHLIRARALLGWALWNLGRGDEAEQELTRARAELEKSGLLYGVLAEIAETRGDSREAAHLRNVQAVLRPGEDRAAPAPTAGGEAASAGIEPQESPVMGILSSLLLGFERKPARAPVLGALFSPADRNALKSLLSEGALAS
jgi:tetratricopeptide (TPR) repeat protein